MITATTMSDAQIEYWAGMYRANPSIAARGITFEAFLTQPEFYLRGVALRYALPAKEAAQLREALGPIRVVANGRTVEKLRHHRFPRSRHQFMKAAP